MKTRTILVVLICIILLGCDNMAETNKSKNNEIQTELGILPKLISLPKQPVSVKWRLTENLERRTGYLVALLKFKESDYKYILDNSQSFENKINAKILIEIYDKWLPDDAKTCINVKFNGELYELIGIFGLKPNLFNKTQFSPYIHGEITPLDNGYICVVLASM